MSESFLAAVAVMLGKWQERAHKLRLTSYAVSNPTKVAAMMAEAGTLELLAEEVERELVKHNQETLRGILER